MGSDYIYVKSSGETLHGAYRCAERCGRPKFYYSKEREKSEKALPKRICPECGDEHDFDYPKCPRCKFDYYK